MLNKEVKKTGLLLIITIAVIWYRDLMNTNLPFVVFSGLALISGLTLGTGGRFLYVCTLLPFCRGLPYSEIMLIILVVEAASLVIKKDKIKVAYLYIPIVIIAAIELIDYIVFDVNSIEIVYLLVYMLFTTYAIGNKVFRGLEREYIEYYAFAVVIAVSSVIIREINILGLDVIFTYNIRFGANSEGLNVTNFNANELGLYCVAAIAMLLTLHYHIGKKHLVFLAMIISLLGLVSVSRTYLIVLMLTWVMYFVVSGIKLQRVILVASVFFVVISVAITLLPEFSNWLFDYFKARGEEENTRTPLVSYYIDMILSSPWIFFFGLSEHYPNILRDTAAHNGFLEMFVCWGITGFVAGMLWIFCLHKEVSRSKEYKIKRKLLHYLPIVTFFVFIQTIQLFTMHNYLTLMMLVMVPLSFAKEQENERATQEIDRIRFRKIRLFM